MSAPIDLYAIARHYGGIVSGGQALIPTIGHSKSDRGTAIKLDPDAPDGCLVHCFNGGDPLAEKNRLRGDGFLPKPQAEPRAVAGPWQTVATYEYTCADGAAIYRIIRRQPANWSGPGKRPKRFVAERFEGGRWIAGMGDCERIPYRLPELRQAIAAGEPVFLVEGEAKADRLANWGFAATAIAFGADGWKADYAQHFAGARVIILPDNDDKGRSFARKAYADLKGSASPAIVELPGLPQAGDVIDWNGSAADLEALIADPAEPDWMREESPETPKAVAFEFVAVGDLEYRAPEFLIDGLIETDSLGLFFGDPGRGKSFLAVDLGLSVASGTAFHGREVKQGPVFYIAGEGHNGLARRFQAWSRKRGVPLAGVPLFKSTRAAQFLDGESAKAVAEAVHQLAAQHGAPAMIQIDTLARNFGPGDENSTSEMGQFIAAMDDLKAQFPGCVIVIIHHSGHADKQRARGAMALKGALDFEYRVEKSDAAIRVSNTKMKDAEPPSDVTFELQSVELSDGASSAVLVETEARQAAKSLTRGQKLALDAFCEAAADSDAWGDDGEFLGLSLEPWREVFYRMHTGDNAEAKKKAFQRARKELVEIGRLVVEHDVYRPTDIADKLIITHERKKFASGTGGTDRDNVPPCPGAEAGETGTNGTHAYRRVPCPVPSGHSCDGEGCAWCEQ
jgi:hypothetical protein